MNIKHYANGKMNRVYEEYYSNGQLQKTVTYKDDVPNGQVKEYYRDGRPMYTYTLLNDKRGRCLNVV